MAKESREPAASASEAQGKNEPGKNPQDCKSEEKKLVCGLIMPISAIGDCSASHWEDVKSILIDAISVAGFECKLVSDDDGVGVIQDRIVKNVYNADMVVCDVSHKNPNVMFELGMRLAFDRPVVIVKDDKTDYSFDTSPVEHIEYPRDLRYPVMMKFKSMLSSKVKATYDASKKDGYSPFLSHFGQINIAKIEDKDVSVKEFLVQMRDENVNNNQRLLKIVDRLDSRLSSLEGGSRWYSGVLGRTAENWRNAVFYHDAKGNLVRADEDTLHANLSDKDKCGDND